MHHFSIYIQISSTTAKIREITKHIQRNIISRCNCTFLQQQIFNQTLQCSHQSAIFRAHLLELHSQQHIDQITAWILTNPNITIDEVRYGLNSDCPITISSHDAPRTECRTQHPTQHPTDGTGIDPTILLVVILASVLGILFLVVVICLVVVCCMCCDTNNLIKSRYIYSRTCMYMCIRTIHTHQRMLTCVGIGFPLLRTTHACILQYYVARGTTIQTALF